jgi:hypothetical protein
MESRLSGHGHEMPLPWLYVDDFDLFHMAIGKPSDKEFLQLVQNTTND